MARYIVKRVLLIIPIVLCVMFVIYGLMHSTTPPGRDDRRPLYGDQNDWLDDAFESVGIKGTFVADYIRYVYDVFTKGMFISETFTKVLMKAFGLTMKLTFMSFVASLVLGVLLGTMAALKRDGFWDNLLTSMTTFFAAVPSYTLGLILLLFFAVKLPIFPISGINRPGAFVLPVVTLAANGIASTARLARSSLIQVMDTQYVAFLRVKGMKTWRIIFEHALKNAMLPVVANLSKVIAQMLCSSMVVEFFFSLPGIGQIMKQAIDARESKEVMACGVLIAFVITTSNIVADIIHMAINPEIKNRLAGEKRGK